MNEIAKQCVGIDCAKNDFVVTFSICNNERDIQHLSSRKFLNNAAGFETFIRWVTKLTKPSITLHFVMEATGVYHEKLAYFLYDSKRQISVVLPNRAKNFSKTLKVKKVTDKIASEYLAVMGLEKKLDLWVKPEKIYSGLRHLNREKNRIQAQIVQIKNQIEAESSGVLTHRDSMKRLNDLLKFLTRQKKQVESEIKTKMQSNKELDRKVKLITTIPGVGLMTAAAIIGETNGFLQTRNKRQLISYAGYDVVNQESGTSVQTKARISKRGNRHIRKSMHMPALTAIRHNSEDKNLFIRIVSKTGIKMKGVVAVQRKLLVLIYILWKNDCAFDPEYELKKGTTEVAPLAGSSPLISL